MAVRDRFAYGRRLSGAGKLAAPRRDAPTFVYTIHTEYTRVYVHVSDRPPLAVFFPFFYSFVFGGVVGGEGR